MGLFNWLTPKTRVPQPSGREVEARRVSELIDLIGRADSKTLASVLHRFFVLTEILRIDMNCRDVPFACLKENLRPDQASAIARKVRTAGAKAGIDPVDQMVFTLIAATLHARGGSAWVDPKEAAFINTLIATSEDIALN